MHRTLPNINLNSSETVIPRALKKKKKKKNPKKQKTAPRRQEGKSSYIQVCNKGSRQSEHQKSDIELRNLAFCLGRCKPLGSLNSFLSYAPHLSGANPVSLFSLLLAFSQVLLLLAFLQLLSNLCGVGQHPLDEVLGGLIHTGDQKLLMAVTFLVY